MQCEKIKVADFDAIRALQPEGWLDIREAFRQYSRYGFCYPVKVLSGGRIVGVGCTILSGNSAWLAHIMNNGTIRKIQRFQH